MHTTICQFDAAGMLAALDALHRGAIIAFPTDTIYGVGGNVLDARVCLKVFAAKDRPPTVPLPVLLADVGDLDLIADPVPPLARQIAAQAWPGALTLVLSAAAHLPRELLGGRTTVAIRIPAHDMLRSLIREFGAPLAGTSANRHGQPNCTSAAEVQAQLDGRIPLILDGGPSGADRPSTILDLSGKTPQVLRQGVFDLATLEGLPDLADPSAGR
jgi:L-threonylcarbamoyladenylate synthase